jgi:transcriptional regulator GlxA family with amidase domain
MLAPGGLPATHLWNGCASLAAWGDGGAERGGREPGVLARVTGQRHGVVCEATMTNVAIYLFDEVEVLDFAGPFEVFSTASRLRVRAGGPPVFRVFTVADRARSVRARGGLMVNAEFGLDDHPRPDLLIIPGGDVTDELPRADIVEWIARTAAASRLTASVCTGALLLAQAGLLNDSRATTHWEDLEQLRRDFPAVRVEGGTRWIDAGKIVTSAGISAGIDMSLHLVRRLADQDLATRTARQMDFTWEDRGS